eukprot:jgi/Picsp_1/1293/NSC_04774-R1_nodulin glutamate-ammonia ligase-like protein
MGPGLARVCLFLPCWGDAGVNVPDKGLGPTGEINFYPNINGPWIPPGTLPGSKDAVVLCEFGNLDGVRDNCCPRTRLKLASLYLEKEFGLLLMLGMETEFILLKEAHGGSDPICPVDNSVYCQSSAFDAGSCVIADICDRLEAIGQRVLQVHCESAHGQFEIATAHGPVLEQVDHAILRKEIIQSTAGFHGFVASFLPKMFENQAGSAAHCHISLVDSKTGGTAMLSKGAETLPGAEISDVSSLSVEAKSFMAGILEHMGAVLPFTAGSPNSFRRVQPSTWAGAYSCWGINNREAAIRVVGYDERSVNFEFKVFDGAVNPYLGMTAVIAAGICGLEKYSNTCESEYDSGILPEPITVDPATLEPKEQQRLGIYRLPTTLEEAMCALESDTVFCRTIEHISQAGDLVTFFKKMKESEVEHFRGLSFVQEREILYKRY